MLFHDYVFKTFLVFSDDNGVLPIISLETENKLLCPSPYVVLSLDKAQPVVSMEHKNRDSVNMIVFTF